LFGSGFQRVNHRLLYNHIFFSSCQGLRKAKLHLLTRKSVLPSDYFIRNYLNSFCEDPIDVESKELPEGETNGFLQ
jgi:hypothetical protein